MNAVIRCVLLGAVAVTPALPLVAQSSALPANAALKDTLVALEGQSWEAWKKRDGAFYQQFLSDDHVEMGAGGRSTKAQVVAFVASPTCIVTSYKTGQFEIVAVDANTALLTYRAEQNTMCAGKAVPSPAWVSSLYVRRNGRWLNSLYQQSPIR
jgi:hypothetical protein